jgi:hypothetical protein
MGLMQNLKSKTIVSLLIFLILIPQGYAQPDMTAKAKIDVAKDVNKIYWFGAGLISGGIGVFFASTMAPEPIKERDIETTVTREVNEYYTGYREEGKRIQTSQAIKGAIINLTVLTIIYYKNVVDRPEFKY